MGWVGLGWVHTMGWIGSILAIPWVGLGWVGFMIQWVVLGLIDENGPTSNSESNVQESRGVA